MANVDILTTLPIEVLTSISTSLTPRDFLAFCLTRHVLQDATDLRCLRDYWHEQVIETFPFPILRRLKLNTGRQWMILYKRLVTQIQVYGWGDIHSGCLGPREQLVHYTGDAKYDDCVAWPVPVCGSGNIESLTDLQCGHSLTTILTASGSIFSTGVSRGFHGFAKGRELMLCAQNETTEDDTRSRSPSPFTQPAEIKQISQAMDHIIGLTEIGTIWQWCEGSFPGFELYFDASLDKSNIKKVVAGSQHLDSAYVEGLGIVVWSVPAHHSTTPIISKYWVVPRTSGCEESRTRKASGITKGTKIVKWLLLNESIIYLTQSSQVFAVHTTSDLEGHSPTFELSLGQQKRSTLDPIVDIHGSDAAFALTLKSGTILTSSSDLEHQKGLVYDLRLAMWEIMVRPPYSQAASPRLLLHRIPALQNNDVITLSFGSADDDAYFHALHANGTISSYGLDYYLKGVLGVGDTGIHTTEDSRGGLPRRSRQLLDTCLTTGRRVHFEREKRDWLKRIETEFSDNMLSAPGVQAEVSEWVEERLNDWERNALARGSNTCGAKGVSMTRCGVNRVNEVNANGTSHDDGREVRNRNGHCDHDSVQADGDAYIRGCSHDCNSCDDSGDREGTKSSDTIGDHGKDDDEDDGLPAYFVLQVAAGFWHSAALVLVNEEKAERVRAAYKQRESGDSVAPGACAGLPRLRLKNGEVMPGTGPVEEWTAPEWKAIETVQLHLVPVEEA